MFLLGRIRERRTARDKIKRKGKEEKIGRINAYELEIVLF